MMTVSCLKSRFRGALLGALLGDCIGSKFEGCENVSRSEIDGHLERIENCPLGDLKYTDDTALTLALCRALNQHNDSLAEIQSVQLYQTIAREFREEFSKEPDRGYGAGAFNLLPSLLNNDSNDPFFEASQMFGGGGSYGNGAAMRVCPVALYCEELQKCILVAEKQAKITHAHAFGFQGAILQAIAIKLALEDPRDSSDKYQYQFLEKLRKEMDNIENDQTVYTRTDSFHKYFKMTLMKMDDLLLKMNGRELSHQDIRELRKELGNEISAHRSVPLAIFVFLQTLNQPFKLSNGEKELSPFCNAILTAIVMGGDTDTIASMCGSIAGAFYGVEDIPKQWIDACESNEVVTDHADNFFTKMLENNTKS